MSLTKIAQIGASGNIGTPILNALLGANTFKITVIARTSSTFTAPDPAVNVIKIDFNDQQALVNALKGQDALLINLGNMVTMEKDSKFIIDAAIQAGVKRVIPSEYGNDLHNLPGREQAVFAVKRNVNTYLDEKAQQGILEYTTVSNGPFFDWGLTTQFLGFDIPNRKATIYSGGNAKVNTTTIDSIARTVVVILSDPPAFKNKPVRIHDFFVTQNEILAILEEETGTKWTVVDVDIEELEKAASAGLAKGEINEYNIYSMVKAHIWGQQSSARWGKDDDSVAIGLPKKHLREEIEKVL